MTPSGRWKFEYEYGRNCLQLRLSFPTVSQCCLRGPMEGHMLRHMCSGNRCMQVLILRNGSRGETPWIPGSVNRIFGSLLFQLFISETNPAVMVGRQEIADSSMLRTTVRLNAISLVRVNKAASATVAQTPQRNLQQDRLPTLLPVAARTLAVWFWVEEG